MTLRSILLHPDPRLKSVAAPVTRVDKVLHALADDMLETMYDAPGIGLAAPQLGIMQRILVMDCIKGDMETPQPIVMINPLVIATSNDTNIYDEGCLSIPDLYAEVERPAVVKIEWMNLDGKTQQEEFSDLWATCVQHEIDHLNGKLFIDYLKPLKRQMITRKMQKLKREIARESKHGSG
jgi:peptide deformylase